MKPQVDAEPRRIIIVDDHPLFRYALKRTLQTGQPGINVVGEVPNGWEALDLCRSLLPGLVMMDLRMPEMDGIEATRAIKQELPRTIVLIITALEDEALLAQALEVGASGYILKTAPPEQIVNAVTKALEGKPALNRELAIRLLLRLIDERQKTETAEPTPLGESQKSSLLKSLTPRETDVLRLIARGHNNPQIARNLLISESTVKKHVRQIITKLGVSDRLQAALRAMELGLLSDH